MVAPFLKSDTRYYTISRGVVQGAGVPPAGQVFSGLFDKDLHVNESAGRQAGAFFPLTILYGGAILTVLIQIIQRGEVEMAISLGAMAALAVLLAAVAAVGILAGGR